MRVFYEFVCEECGEQSEKLLEYKDIKNYIEEHVCQKCGGSLRKVPTFGCAILKGTGFTRKFIK